MNINDTLQCFSKLLLTRLSEGVYCTEDSIRYTFFANLLHSANLKPHHIVLEHPHSSISKAKVDTYVPPRDGMSGLVIEFKYDRAIPSKRNLPRPQKAGKIFNDFFRLVTFEPTLDITRLLVYLTDDAMKNYLTNQRSRLAPFFNLSEGRSLTINQGLLSDTSDTFIKEAGPITPLTLKCVWSEDFPQHNHYLRIYSATRILKQQ